MRATRLISIVCVLGGLSVASPYARWMPARVADSPLHAVAAECREAVKIRKYAPALPVCSPPHEFKPLGWGAYEPVGPAKET